MDLICISVLVAGEEERQGRAASFLVRLGKEKAGRGSLKGFFKRTLKPRGSSPKGATQALRKQTALIGPLCAGEGAGL